MKALFSLMRILIRINIVVLFVCVMFVMANRQQQAQMTAELQKFPYKPETVNWEIKAKLADEQQQRLVNQQQYEQRIKKLEEQLKIYQISQFQAPEVKKFQPLLSPSIPSSRAVALQPAPAHPSPASAFSPPTSPPHPVSSRRIKPQPSQPSLAFPRDIPINSPPFPPTSPSPASPKPSNSALSEQHKVKPSGKDDKLVSEQMIALAKIQESQPETIIPSRQANKSLVKNPNNRKAVSDRSESIAYANDISTGLAIAHDRGQIKYGTKMYRQVQSAIRLLRRGVSKEEAIRKSGVPKNVFEQLIEWGGNRPGRPNNIADNTNPHSAESLLTRQGVE